jgi:transcriptional regulator with XRE-family HTH domain
MATILFIFDFKFKVDSMLIHTVKKLAAKDGSSLRKVANQLNCSPSYLSRVLNGTREPNLNLLRELALFTGFSYDELMKVYIPAKEEKQIDIELLRELFERRKTSTLQRHIKPIAKRPSFIEKKILDNIREVTEFEFTQVTLNLNHEMKPHKHKNNSESLAMLLGEFEGGALCIENGQRFDNVNEWFTFNGRLNHWVEPFIGERYSIILYKR